MTIYIAQYWADVFCKQFTHKDGKRGPQTMSIEHSHLENKTNTESKA